MDTSTSEMSNVSIPVPPSEAEMTDGITTIARLEELLSSIPKPYHSDKESPNPNPNPNPSPNPNPTLSSLLTQYSNFSRALTATSDESCIRHFVKNLNGLGLLVEWTHMAERHSDDVSIADVSTTFLELLEKVSVEIDLPGYESIVDLLSKLACNENPRVKEIASVQHDRWRSINNDACTAGICTDSMNPESVKDESANPKTNLIKDESHESPIQEEEEEEEEKNESNPVSPNFSPVRVPVSPNDDMDALEIARQVAIQVEEEVAQYRETLCSSPEQEEEKETADLPLTESKSNKEKPNVRSGTNSFPSVRDSDSGLTSGTHDVDLVKDSKPDPARESKPDSAEGCGLDLNESLCTDYEAAEPGPIHVAASKGVPPAPSSVPASPPRFETDTGTRWKGTAASTSAFRPAGSGTDRAGTSRTDSGLKRNSSFLGFDLNVAEGDDGTGTAEVVLPPSGDSSTEVSSERAKKLKLDLNRTDEDETAVSIPVPVLINHRLFWPQAGPGGDQSQSSASSSSQRNQNLTRDFDLNDDLACRTEEGQDPNFINILGSKLTVKNNPVPSHQTTSLTLHSFLGPTPPVSHSGPYQPYQSYQSQMTHTGFVYQHNMVPQNWYSQASTSYTVPSHFTRHMVGPVPVSVPVPVPVQENGLSVGLSLMPGQGFGYGSGSNPYRPGLDLNAGGTGSLEASSSREAAGFRQFFVQSHGGPVPEPVQNSVPVPGTGLRWRDPDCERDTGFSYGFKQLI